MAHIDVKDPETGLWACWSTIVDDYISDWLPENEYKAFVLKEALISSMQYKEDLDFNSIISVEVKDNTSVFTVKDLSLVTLHPSDWYSKQECDEYLAKRQRCDACNHANCEDCDDGDRFEPDQEEGAE